MNEPSIAYNQSDFAYRKEEGVNQSSLKKILESPAHYQAALKQRMVPTPAMEMGTALHALVLDGEKAFEAQYVKKPDGIKLTTKEGKEWKESIGRKKVLSTGGKDDPWGSVQGMSESLRRLAWFDPSQEDYIKHNEVSVYWDEREVSCKARLDRVLVDEGIVLDLKTTDSVEAELFTKKVVSLGYDFQAGAYSSAAEAAFGKPFRFYFVCVERKAPYTVAVYEVDEAMMSEGKYKFEKALGIYKKCKESDAWPNKEINIEKLSYPSWYVPCDGKMEESSEDLF